MINKNIFFIGVGNMGEGILKAIIEKGLVSSNNITAYNRRKEKNQYVKDNYGVNISENIKDNVDKADIIIIAVKPQDIGIVLENIKNCKSADTIIASIAAGIEIKTIENYVGSSRKVVRVMPNSIFESGYGTSAIAWNDNLSEEDTENVKSIFKTIGEVIVLKERLFNAFTAFSVSGCAFILEYMEAMSEAGVLVGFKMDQAMEIVTENFIGCAKLINESKKYPYEYKVKIASPAGTTISGLNVLNKSGFKGIVQECIKTTMDRGNELGE